MEAAATLEHALFYASLGWKVFPVHSVDAGAFCTCGDQGCRHVAKHPRTVNGLKDASDDEALIRAWWERWPDANIGVRTGEESGIWVLDVDLKNGGDVTYQELATDHQAVEGVRQITGSGGWHLVFAWDHAAPPARTRTSVLPGVDVRGAGGYVVVPPSLHETGNRYRWAEDSSPDEADVKPAPSWLLELACADTLPGGAPAPVELPAQALPAAEVASIRDALTAVEADDYNVWLRVGMALHATGAGEQAFGIWSDWSASCPSKFDPKAQRRKWWSFRKRSDVDEVTVASVFGLARARGWSGAEVLHEPVLNGNGHHPPASAWPAAEDFGLSAMPRHDFPLAEAFPPALSWLRDYVAELARSRQVPVDLPAMLVLPFATVASAKKYEAQVFPGWRETNALWVAAAMESGEGKSGVLRALQAPLVAWEKEKREAALGQIARHDNDVQTLRQRLRVLRDKVAKGKVGEEAFARAAAERLGLLEAATPTIPQAFTTDATTEALAQALLENRERFLVAAAEADPLDVALGRYSRSGDPNLGVWLAGHAGDAYKISRRGRTGEALLAPALSVAICPQPGAMEALFGSRMAQERGFVARFLFSLPRSRAGWRTIEDEPPLVPVELEERWSCAVRWLLNLETPTEPEAVGLCGEAFARLQTLREELELSYRDPSGGRSAASPPWYKKLAGTVVRIALALHVLQLYDDPRQADMIDGDTFRAALAWVPYLEAHLRLLLEAATEDSGVPLGLRLLQWLDKAGPVELRGFTFSRRDAFNAVRRRGGSAVATVDQVDPALGLLVEGGWIRAAGRAEARGPRGGRPPSPRFEVRPDLRELRARYA